MEQRRKNLTQLFIPICLETLLYMLSGMVDTLMLSSVNDQAVGAVGTANTYIGIFIIMFSVISSGMVAVMTQNIGAGRPGVAYQARQLGLAFNAVLGVIMSLFLSLGASVTHVDASKGMVTWAKENAISSGLKDAPIRWLVDDCVKFVEREIRRGNHYDAIIMDPPSYGRGPKGEIWKIEESVYPLIQLCSQILTDNPLFFLINSYTTGLQPAVLSYMISTVLGTANGTVTASEIGLPVSSNGLVLPCGASGRYEATGI